MAKDLIVNGVTYPGTDIMEMQTTGGGKALFADTGDTTVTAAAMLKGTKARDKDGVLTEGTIEEVEPAVPTISVAGDGVVTTWAYQQEGLVKAQEVKASKQLEAVTGREITPSATQQTVYGNRYLKGNITVKGDAALVPENIVKGVTIFDVEGAAETGSVEPPDSLALDPDVVYATTRPKDWPKLPTPGDDEAYLLCCFPGNMDGVFVGNLIFTGSCTVEAGRVQDGKFVAQDTFVPTTNTRFAFTIPYANYTDITSDGDRLCVIRIKGAVKSAKFEKSENELVYNLIDPLDAVIGFSTGQNFWWGSTNNSWLASKRLRYVRFVGNGNGAITGTAYACCRSLLIVSAEKEQTPVGNATYMFYQTTMTAISDTLLVSGISYNYAFSATGSTLVPPEKVFIPSGAVSLFRNSAVCKVDMSYIDTSQCSDLSYLFYTTNVKEVVNLNISAMTNATNMFRYSYLRRLTFAGETTPGGWTIDLQNGKMTHNSLVEMINSLPLAATAATISIPGNPGASELTDEEIAVATAKNWTVTI